jgi:hypothetical protein
MTLLLKFGCGCVKNIHDMTVYFGEIGGDGDHEAEEIKLFRLA